MLPDLEKRKTALSSGQRAELERRLHGVRDGAAVGIPRASRATPLPLSYAQERIWLHDQLFPGSLVYNRPTHLRLRGPLNVEALRQALQQIVRRHEALRTTVAIENGQAWQRVHDGHLIDMHLTDVSDMAAAESQARKLAVEHSRAALDLQSGPLVRARLVRIAEADHLLLLTFHHFAFDAWSQNILMRELALNYEAFAASRMPCQPELAIQYSDYAAWERRPDQSSRSADRRSFWRRELADPPLLQLPTDFPRPHRPNEAAGQVEIHVPPPVVSALRELARDEHVTLFSALFAAFTALLYRYSEQDDMIVGCPVATRPRRETEDLIGVFINILPFRTKLQPALSFRQLIRDARDTTCKVLEHQDVPFQLIVQDVLTDRDASAHPLFQALFIYESFSLGRLAAAGVTIQPVHAGSGATHVDLSLELIDDRHGITGYFYFREDLWQAATIERMGEHFLKLLEGIVANPDSRISKLPLLTDRERRRMLVEWNDTASEFPRDQCVHELFEAQVERTPDAVALVFEDQRLTYRELNERGNRLAHYLRAKSVGPGVLVGLCLPRSIDLVVAILGILKAGGAYLPLDAAYPRKRLEFLLQDTAVRLLIADTGLIEQLPSDLLEFVCLDSAHDVLATQSCANPTRLAHADDLAYVIYTSGSTGKPKGVEVAHQSVVNVLTSVAALLELQPGERMLGFASPTFDISVAEFVMPMLAGGITIMTGRDVVYDSSQIIHAIRKQHPRIIQATPATWQMLADCEGWGDPELVIISTGEALPKSLAQRLQRKCGVLWDLYGPTEATIWSTARRVTVPSNSIGRPIANTQAFVLDSQQQLVPIGVWGELYIGGEGLARGYLNRPELSAERFIANPFDANSISRVYRTGDRVRWLADGNLEYQGRLDNQVKLHGFRIELGEIESALREHEGVAQCAALLREDRPDDKRLVAYWVPRSAAQDLGLREYLSQRLPAYMVPSAFVRLESLPLTPSGKLDRQSLPAPDRELLEFDSSYVAPRNPVESSLADIWSEVLNIEPIGIHDNFFALGGDSLSAIQVIARICAALMAHLQLRDIFDAPTIAELSARVAALRTDTPEWAHRQPTRIDRTTLEHLPPSYAQEGMWFLEQLAGESVAYNVPYAIQLRGPLDVEVLRKALETIVQRHEPLRTTFKMSDGELEQIIQPATRFELPVVDLSELLIDAQDVELASLYREEAERRFDLTAGLMMRATLLQRSASDHVLLLVMHHIAWDGWSQEVFWRELGALYDAHRSNDDFLMPELTVEYVDYALWQRNELRGEKLDRLVEYWRKQLDGVTVLELPTDHPRPSGRSYQGACHDFVLPSELVHRLQELGRTEGVTLQMTLLAAFKTLLSRYSGQRDMAIGTPIAGRNLAEFETQIGLFVNTLVLRTDLSGATTFRELLSRVRAISLGAYDHQELPFETLVKELHPERHSNRTPLFQVLFQLLNVSDDGPNLAGLDVSRLPNPSHRVRGDLEMNLWTQAAGVRGEIFYSTELFDLSTIERLGAHYLTLLESIVSNPDGPIGRLPILTEHERRQSIVGWNDTATDYPRDKCLHQLFEEQAQKTPTAIAVVCEKVQTTYQELNERANQLAHYLRTVGVGPNVVVGVLLDRSLEMVVGLLGILKAGGAYLPLPTDYPADRLRFMLEDASAQVVLAARALSEVLQAGCFTLVDFHVDADRIAASSTSNLPELGTAESTAYAMYTSGSTGQPKGAAIAHRGVVRLVRGQTYAEFDSSQRFLWLASPAFDASTFEIWGPLLNGATCAIYPERLLDLAILEEVIRSNQVTCLWLTAGLFNAIIDQRPSVLESVHHVLTGGEVLSVSHVTQALKLFPGLRLTNGYGPTESTTFACTFEITSDMTFPTGSVPIGRPIANTRVYVLDEQQQPVPIGIPGELYIGGDGLARGYLNRPELTAEKFVEDPFSGVPGARMYRTGDQVRWQADGNLEFLGRLDQQVKLRGFRIELGEIEAELMRQPQVRQAVVVLREDRPGDKRLAAYLVAHSADAVAGLRRVLRRNLQERLPEYMIPSAIVFLDALPLNANGKVDRKALPAPEGSHPDLEAGHVAPRNPVEESLAAFWCEMLGISQVGIHDNFFHVGGNSLLAVQVIERINRQFKAGLRIVDLFSRPTIAQLENIVRSPQPERPADEFLSVLRPSTDRGSVVWIGGHITGLLKSLAVTIGIFRLAVDGVDIDTFHGFDIDATVDCYATELLRARPQGPLVIVGFSYTGLLAYALALRLRDLYEERVEVVLLEPSVPQPFELPAPRTLFARMGHYCRKLVVSGPIVLYHSARYRLTRSGQELPPHMDAETAKKWSMCLPYFLRDLAAYRPPHPLRDGVHLVASAHWLRQNLHEFKTQLHETPHVLSVSDVTHLDLPNRDECIAAWMPVIDEILVSR